MNQLQVSGGHKTDLARVRVVCGEPSVLALSSDHHQVAGLVMKKNKKKRKKKKKKTKKKKKKKKKRRANQPINQPTNQTNQTTLMTENENQPQHKHNKMENTK